ncbi:hypothetical protein Y032_0437g1455 [Ancylostoma ceylanicum]|uniref:Uncharacterized protein n=1 Tax=Ancylostoma ceylanicum TaxID=53326 RepID=A0A016X1M2_9BILA|nr:hypothetical protein Y032_0437g1455 [Ancylostoma ceylanicum]
MKIEQSIEDSLVIVLRRLDMHNTSSPSDENKDFFTNFGRVEGSLFVVAVAPSHTSLRTVRFSLSVPPLGRPHRNANCSPLAP